MTREYTFVTGPETPTQPTAGTPSVDEDFVTKGYADIYYTGGGGGSLTWNPQAGYAPLLDEENGEAVYLFENNVTQRLVAFVKVPPSYNAGSQVKAYIGIYTTATSNNIFMKSTSYLIRKETDAVTSTTNSHASTNSEITNSAPASKLRVIELDLTDADGEVNSVAVSAGDILRVIVTRDWGSESTSDTNATRFIPNATAITFS